MDCVAPSTDGELWVQTRDDILARARSSGWAAAGVTDVAPFLEARRRGLQAIAEGRMNGMPWYTPQRVRAATDLRPRYPWAQSLLALAWPYTPAALTRDGSDPAETGERVRGRMAAYACIENESNPMAPTDYHILLSEQCDILMGWIAKQYPDVRSKRFIDHGWAMDRAIAERAGIGFAGKNASLITTQAGSYVLLAELLLSLSLPPTPRTRKNCGSCNVCIPKCPTNAIVSPGVINAPRCISYLTIEHRGTIPLALRPLMGTWIFGCDICQEVCPINHRVAPRPGNNKPSKTTCGPVPFPDLTECLALSQEQFAQRFHGTAVWRTGRAGLARNAAVALGNAGDVGAIPHLQRAAATDSDPVVRESACWALDRLAGKRREATGCSTTAG